MLRLCNLDSPNQDQAHELDPATLQRSMTQYDTRDFLKLQNIKDKQALKFGKKHPNEVPMTERILDDSRYDKPRSKNRNDQFVKSVMISLGSPTQSGFNEDLT